MRLSLLLVLLAACGSDTNLGDTARCDGILNTSEQAVDAGFDADGDGYFDADNPQCQQTYDAAELDCDEADPDVNPGHGEDVCNGIDDDCDEATDDEPDSDGDGATPCEGDCDDDQPSVGPGRAEEACDGLDNDCDASTSDGADVDGDTYTVCDDCDDEDPDVSPADTEVACNGADDDCNEATLDGNDVDGDGMVHCFDCDDADPFRFPGATEVCEDGIDQDCDGNDAVCVTSYDGVWSTQSVSYTCAQGSVDIDFSSVSVVTSGTTISFTYVGPGSQPGTTTGTLTGGAGFDTTYSIPGLCTEEYRLQGSFTSATTFTGTLTARFIDTSGIGFGCLNCADQTWTLNGSR